MHSPSHTLALRFPLIPVALSFLALALLLALSVPSARGREVAMHPIMQGEEEFCVKDGDCPEGYCTAGRGDCFRNPQCGHGGSCDETDTTCYGFCKEGKPEGERYDDGKSYCMGMKSVCDADACYAYPPRCAYLPEEQEHCRDFYEMCEGSVSWRSCVRGKDPSCFPAEGGGGAGNSEKEEGYGEGSPPDDASEEADEYADEEGDEDDDESEVWLEKLRDTLSSLDEEARKCVEEVIGAWEARCAVSAVPHCLAKTVQKALLTDGKCGVAAMPAETAEPISDEYYEKYEEGVSHMGEGQGGGGGGGGGGCIPPFATLDHVKREIEQRGASPEDILRVFAERKQMVARIAEERYGVDPDTIFREWEKLPVCAGGFMPGGPMPGPGMPPMPHGGGMGMGPMMGPGDGGPNVGEIFGRAVGMLVQLSQNSGLPEDLKQQVREALLWFSAATGKIAEGGEVGPLVAEAKEHLHRIQEMMGKMGGMGMMGPPPEAREHVLKVLAMMRTMLGRVKEAFSSVMPALFAEEGYTVSFEGWETPYSEVSDMVAAAEAACSGEQLSQDCFQAMESIGAAMEEKLKGFADHAAQEAGVPPEVQERIFDMVGRKLGLDDSGMGPPPAMHEGMGPPPWATERVRECVEQGGDERECFEKVMGEMGPGRMGPPAMQTAPWMGEMMRQCMEGGETKEACFGKLQEKMHGDFSPGAFPMGPEQGPMGPGMMQPFPADEWKAFEEKCRGASTEEDRMRCFAELKKMHMMPPMPQKPSYGEGMYDETFWQEVEKCVASGRTKEECLPAELR